MIPALVWVKQVDLWEFEASLVDKMNSRTPRAKPGLQKKKKKKKEQKLRNHCQDTWCGIKQQKNQRPHNKSVKLHTYRAWEVAQLRQRLLYKYEGLLLYSSNLNKKHCDKA